MKTNDVVTVKVPGFVREDQLVICRKLVARINEKPVTLNGKEYKPFQVLYQSFAGPQGERGYEGNHYFDVCQAGFDRKKHVSADLNEIPNLEKKSNAVTNPSAPVNDHARPVSGTSAPSGSQK